MTPPPDPVAALAEALSNHEHHGLVKGTLVVRRDHVAHVTEPFDCAGSVYAALTASGWSLSHDSERRSAVIGSERSDNEALEAALEGLWEAANRYRQDVAKANEYLNQDLPSARSLVFALGKARSAIEGRP